MYYVSGGKCSPNTPALGPGTQQYLALVGSGSIKINGGTYTYYIPKQGSSTKLTKNGTYYAYAAVNLTVEGPSGWFRAANLWSRSRYTGPSCP